MKLQPESIVLLIKNLKEENNIKESSFGIQHFEERSIMVLDRMRKEQPLMFCTVIDLFCGLCSNNTYTIMRNYMFLMSVFKNNPSAILGYADLVSVAKRDLDGKVYDYSQKVTNLLSALILALFGGVVLSRFCDAHKEISEFTKSESFMEPPTIGLKLRKTFLAEGYDVDGTYFKKP